MNLNILDLSDNNINFNGIISFDINFSHKSKLVELNLNNNKLKSSGFNYLITALKNNNNKNLKYLSVANNYIEDESLIYN